MAMKSVRDIEIHYELHGDRGPVVLLVHGLGSSLRDWEYQVTHLARAIACSPSTCAVTARPRAGPDHDGRLRRRPSRAARRARHPIFVRDRNLAGRQRGVSDRARLPRDRRWSRHHQRRPRRSFHGEPGARRGARVADRPCASRACAGSVSSSQSDCCPRASTRQCERCSSSAGRRTIPICIWRASRRSRTGARALDSLR